MKLGLRSLCLAVTAVGCLSCAKGYPPPPAPTLYTAILDSSFTVDESQQIVDASRAWGAVCEDITFTFVIADRTTIDNALEASVDKDSLYFMRTDDTTQIPPECVILDHGFGCTQGPRAYLPEQDLTASYDGFKKVPAHLEGHWWGLQHSTGNDSIMEPDIATMAIVPQEFDCIGYCLERGCPLHQHLHGGKY